MYFASGRGFMRHRIPPFANGTSDEAQQQLREIFKNKSLTKEQINEKVQEWVNSQDSAVQSAYQEFEAKRNERAEQLRSKIETADLSEKANSALKQIGDLFSNNSITIGDERRQIKDILSGLNRDERKQVKEVLHENRRDGE